MVWCHSCGVKLVVWCNSCGVIGRGGVVSVLWFHQLWLWLWCDVELVVWCHSCCGCGCVVVWLWCGGAVVMWNWSCGVIGGGRVMWNIEWKVQRSIGMAFTRGTCKHH